MFKTIMETKTKPIQNEPVKRRSVVPGANCRLVNEVLLITKSQITEIVVATLR